MGRWGSRIYDSDGSLDFLSTVTDILMKEASHLFSPEQVRSSTGWLRDALTLVEMMLILTDENLIGHSSHLMGEYNTVRRWQNVFFEVWDGDWEDWNEYESPYWSPAYRVEHRPTVMQLFKRLIEIADYWERVMKENPTPTLLPSALVRQLPLFSITRLQHSNGANIEIIGTALNEFVERMIQKLVLIFSEENREREWAFGFFSEFEEIWVCVDLIGMFCEKYQTSPGLAPRTIQRWLDIMLGLWLHYDADPNEAKDVQTLAETDSTYPYVMAAFVRLITVAQQHRVGWEL